MSISRRFEKELEDEPENEARAWRDESPVDTGGRGLGFGRRVSRARASPSRGSLGKREEDEDEDDEAHNPRVSDSCFMLTHEKSDEISKLL